MKWLSTTIKKEYMMLILAGVKRSEFKGNSEYWNKRITNLKDNLKYNRSSPPNYEWFDAKDVSINFLCGRKSYKYEVFAILRHHTPMEIDGVYYPRFWEIR